jgi:hypothetical protein
MIPTDPNRNNTTSEHLRASLHNIHILGAFTSEGVVLDGAKSSHALRAEERKQRSWILTGKKDSNQSVKLIEKSIRF